MPSQTIYLSDEEYSHARANDPNDGNGITEYMRELVRRDMEAGQ